MKNWKVDSIASAKLDDGNSYYARLLEFPWAAFYDCRTAGEPLPVADVVKTRVLFTIAAHKSLVESGGWQVVGKAAPDPALGPPAEQAIWDTPDECRIIDAEARMKPGTPEYCRTLEPAWVWEPPHIAERLKDSFAGHPERWREEMLAGL